MKGIIGKKVGMTSIFDPSGKQTACTIIEAGPCVVTQVRTKETDGYEALQLSFGDKNDKHSTLAEKNHFAKANTSPKKFSKEFRNISLQKNIGSHFSISIADPPSCSRCYRFKFFKCHFLFFYQRNSQLRQL